MVLDEASKVQGETVEELRVEWRRLWRERFDDKLRAEGIANQDYSLLSVEKGTVIFATRNFRSLSLKEILKERGVSDLFKFVSPSPNEGGWRKFINGTAGVKRSGHRRALRCYVEEEKKPQQLKKGGRGWLHV